MRKPQFIGILAIILFTLVLSATVARAQPALSTVFTYQGSLTDNGTPANGLYDFRFRLLDAPTGGSQVGPVLTRDDLVVQQGLFVTALDFGAVFNGSPRYLEISVRPGASTGELTVLSPRQEFTAAPMALFSGTSRVSESALALQGRPIGSVAPATGQVLKWNGSQWLPNSDDNTTYTAGQGLSLTSNRFEVRFAGSGSSTSAARSDHNHFGQNWTGNVGFTALWIQNNSTASGAAGLVGISVNSAGLDGRSTSGAGLRGVSTTGYGVWANGGTGRGVETRGDAYGVFASSSTIGGRGAALPNITGLDPSARSVGSPGFTLTISGTNFVTDSVVAWEGSPRPTSYVSPNLLRATISAADLVSARQARVTVINPVTADSPATATLFAIENPLPVITRARLEAAGSRPGARTLVVEGSGFADGATLQWAGDAQPTLRVDANRIEASVDFQGLSSGMEVPITVYNPGPGGGLSNSYPVTINDSGNSTLFLPLIAR